MQDQSNMPKPARRFRDTVARLQVDQKPPGRRKNAVPGSDAEIAPSDKHRRKCNLLFRKEREVAENNRLSFRVKQYRGENLGKEGYCTRSLVPRRGSMRMDAGNPTEPWKRGSMAAYMGGNLLFWAGVDGIPFLPQTAGFPPSLQWGSAAGRWRRRVMPWSTPNPGISSEADFPPSRRRSPTTTTTCVEETYWRPWSVSNKCR